VATAGAAFCTQCGAQVLDHEPLFCSSCGARLRFASEAEIARPGDPRPSVQPTPPLLAAATDGWGAGPDEGVPSGALGVAEAAPAWTAPSPGPGPAAIGPAPIGPPVAPVRRGFWERVTAGWELSVRCLQLMKTQPGLLAVPVISTVVIVVLFILAAVVASALPGILALLWWLAALAVMAGIGVGGQAVIVHRIGSVLRGGTCTNAQAFAAVVPKWRTLLAWGAISLSVGVAIRSLERRGGLVGLVLRIVGVALAIAWSALTFFMVPVIVFEDLTVRDAIRRSRELVRDNWGEGVVGVGVLTAMLNLVFLGVVVLGVLLITAHALVLALMVFLAAIVGSNLLSAVASPVFVVVLYNYATCREISFGFDEADLVGVFRPRRRRAFAGI